jgi:hypothetical protein
LLFLKVKDNAVIQTNSQSIPHIEAPPESPVHGTREKWFAVIACLLVTIFAVVVLYPK